MSNYEVKYVNPGCLKLSAPPFKPTNWRQKCYFRFKKEELKVQKLLKVTKKFSISYQNIRNKKINLALKFTIVTLSHLSYKNVVKTFILAAKGNFRAPNKF